MPGNPDRTPRWSRFHDYRPRRDTASERNVETSFELQHYCGIAYAAVYLQAHGIEIDLALRVLLKPKQRRTLIF